MAVRLNTVLKIMHALSLHLDGKTLKVALLHREKNTFRVDLLRAFTIEEEANVKPLYILAPILAGKQVKTITALKASEMLIRELDIKLEKKSAIKDALPFQIETLLPYPLEESIVLPFFGANYEGATSVTLFATTKSQLKEHLEETAAIGVDSDIVSCLPSAMARLKSFTSSSAETLYLGHFEERQCVFTYLADKRLMASTSLPIGKSHFIEALQKDLPEKSLKELEEIAKNIDLSSIEGEMFPHLFHCKEQFCKDLHRLLSFLEGKSKTTGGEFVLSGDLVSIFHFKSYFANCVGPEISLGTFLEFQNHSTAEIESYAIPIGLALDALASDGKSVQFRQGEFLPVKQIQKRKKQLSVYLASCLVLSVLTLCTSFLFVKKREAQLLEKLYTYREFGEETRELHKGISLVDEVENWERELSNKKKPFPYISTAPKISDLLAWLSTHPELSPKLCANGDKIEITNVRYQLQKYPKLGEAVEPYIAKVDLEFMASSPSAAEAFHESLQSGEGLANEKKEISWKGQQGNYKTSFFLKSMRGD